MSACMHAKRSIILRSEGSAGAQTRYVILLTVQRCYARFYSTVDEIKLFRIRLEYLKEYVYKKTSKMTRKCDSILSIYILSYDNYQLLFPLFVTSISSRFT